MMRNKVVVVTTKKKLFSISSMMHHILLETVILDRLLTNSKSFQMQKIDQVAIGKKLIMLVRAQLGLDLLKVEASFIMAMSQEGLTP